MAIITSEKKVVVFIEFSSKSEGVDVMSNFKNPCAFIAGSKKYDYLGSEISFTEEYYTVPNTTMNTIKDGDGKGEDFGTMFVEEGFCKVNKLDVITE